MVVISRIRRVLELILSFSIGMTRDYDHSSCIIIIDCKYVVVIITLCLYNYYYDVSVFIIISGYYDYYLIM